MRNDIFHTMAKEKTEVTGGTGGNAEEKFTILALHVLSLMNVINMYVRMLYICKYVYIIHM